MSIGARPLGYQGRLSSAQGTLFNIDYQNLNTRLVLAKQVVRVDELKFAAMDGLLQGSGDYAFGGPTPSFRVAAKIHGVDIEQYARAVLRAEAKRLRGRLQLDATLAGKGRGWEEILSTLDGRGDLTGRIDFAGALSLSSQMTQDLVHAVKQVKYLAGKDGKLEIPFTLKGMLPRVMAKPDLSRLGRSLRGGFLDDVLKKLPNPSPLVPGQGETKNRDDKQRAGKEILRKGLEWLLGRWVASLLRKMNARAMPMAIRSYCFANGAHVRC